MLANALLALLYFIAGKWGLTLAFVHVSATAVWPPSGIALAAFLVLGYRVWPGIFLGAFLVNITTAGTVLTTAGIATGNTLEGLVGAYLVNRFAGGRRAFRRPQDVFKFAALGGMLSTMVSATIGVSSLSLGGFARWTNFWPIWLTWWLGDAAGDIVAAPFLVLWAEKSRARWNAARLAEAGAVLFGFFVYGEIVFGGIAFSGTNLPLEYLCIPLLLWAAFRFGQREAATSIVVLAGLAIRGTLHGAGPFVMASENESLLLLQAFMGVLSLTTLAVASVVAQRNAADDALRASIRELESFAYAASHDLRTPLRSIGGFSKLLLMDYGARLDAQAHDYLRRVEAAALRMSEIIDALLDLSRVARLELRREPVDLSGIAETTVCELRENEPERQAEISVDKGLVANADSNLARIVLQNLLGNAWKFTKHCGVARIRVGRMARRDGPVYFVEDNGIGFDPALAGKLFKPFERLHRDDEFGGTGIGLASVQRIVSRHGGRVWAESVPGHGATFYFTL